MPPGPSCSCTRLVLGSPRTREGPGLFPGSPMGGHAFSQDCEDPHPRNSRYWDGPELTQFLGKSFQMTVFLG